MMPNRCWTTPLHAPQVRVRHGQAVTYQDTSLGNSRGAQLSRRPDLRMDLSPKRIIHLALQSGNTIQSESRGAQCTTTGYTQDVSRTAYARYPSNLHRSATAPLTIVAAVAANCKVHTLILAHLRTDRKCDSARVQKSELMMQDVHALYECKT